MDILSLIEKIEFTYLKSFTNMKETSWGYLFWDNNQPVYYDANHAHIRQVPSHPVEVIEEVKAFYENLNIIPRFYIYNCDKQTNLINKLIHTGFGYEELTNPVQLWNGDIIKLPANQDVTVELVTEDNFHEAMMIECSIKELGGKEVREQALRIEFENSNYTHYLLRVNGVACSTACIFQVEEQARLESVATLEEYRGQGLIGHLISYLQEEIHKREIKHFWVFPINENVEKVYSRYGFKTLDTVKTGHAFLGGKSIKEIHEGE